MSQGDKRFYDLRISTSISGAEGKSKISEVAYEIQKEKASKKSLLYSDEGRSLPMDKVDKPTRSSYSDLIQF